MVCSDTSAVHSVITIKQDEDKIIPVDSHKVFCIAGEAGDRVQFSDYVIANIKLYALRNETELSTKSVANYARGELAAALRKVGGGRGCGERGRQGRKGGRSGSL
jgi:20S proteasome subunit beta 4